MVCIVRNSIRSPGGHGLLILGLTKGKRGGDKYTLIPKRKGRGYLIYNFATKILTMACMNCSLVINRLLFHEILDNITTSLFKAIQPSEFMFLRSEIKLLLTVFHTS